MRQWKKVQEMLWGQYSMKYFFANFSLHGDGKKPPRVKLAVSDKL